VSEVFSQIETPSLVLPLMMLRPATVPLPTCVRRTFRAPLPRISTPYHPFGSAAPPVALVPIRLPSTDVSFTSAASLLAEKR